MQAIHDILYHGTNITQYDHLQFPGVVPRTFLGALAVGAVCYPAVSLFKLMDVPKIYAQLLCRCVLAVAVSFAFARFTEAVGKRTNPTVARLAIVFTCTQFHFLFYASRTLPNTFALVLVLRALASWLVQDNKKFLWYSAAAIIMFRAELCIFLGLLLLVKLIDGEMGLLDTIRQCLVAGPLILGCTVLVDSYFWRRWLWPEGEVLYYNTVLNKSSNWGTMPYSWYLYSAIPRGMMFTLFLVPFGFFQRQNRTMSKLNTSALTYVLLYSLLPHKELRFIIYVFPVFNVCAAVGAFNVVTWCRRRFASLRLATVGCLTLIVVANVAPSFLLAHISSLNYAGGNAFSFLHSLNKHMAHDRLSVHVSNAAAQTGVTRFGELHTAWSYSKDEDFFFDATNEYASPYSLLLLEGSCPVTKRYETQAVINGFHGWRLRKVIPFFEILKSPKICILKVKGLR